MNFIPMFSMFSAKPTRYINKFKTTGLLILAFFLFAHSGAFGQQQNFNISRTNARVAEILETLQRTSSYGIFYQDSDIDLQRRVSIDVKNGSINEVLDQLFRGTDNTYTVSGQQVTIKKSPAVAQRSAGGTVQAQRRQDIVVTGRVTDSSGSPIIGANVLQLGTTNGVSTGIDGNYRISVPEDSAVQFSYLGYETVLRTFAASDATDGLVAFDISLATEGTDIEDVVVIGYGVRKKGTVVGSVSTVKAADINDVPSATLEQALQGKAPGLQVVSSTGEPSTVSSLKIRGVNSINSGTTPLVVVDGIAVSSSYFAALNPNDIEDVSVLKDASSTSIFGSRAANGVIMITTKKGKTGEGVVTFRTQIGFSNLAYGNWDMMNTSERIRYEHEVGIASPTLNYEELAKTDVNWLKKVFKNNAPVRLYEVNMAGGSPNFTYYVSGSYFGQEGIAPNSDFDRYTLRTNMEFRANDWLKIGTTNALSKEAIQTAIGTGNYYTNAPLSAAFFMLPYYNPYNEDGSLASLIDGSWKGMGVFTENPLEYGKYNRGSTKRYKLLTSLFAEITPIAGLRIRSTGFIDYQNASSVTSYDLIYPTNGGEGRMSKSTSSIINLSLSNVADYSFDLEGEHFFTVTAGQEMQDDYQESLGISVSGLNNRYLMSVGTAPRTDSWSDPILQSSLLSFFGRAEYNYLGKYYGEASVRTDGSSRFGRNNRFGTFWSAGVMWNLTGEEFMSGIEWIDAARLRIGYGTQGNSSIPNYLHQALVAAGPEYNGYPGIAVSSRGNEDLTWEKVTSLNVGLNVRLLRRIDLGVEFYDKKTTDMLMEVPVSMVNGFDQEWDNVGEMSNRGFEIDLGVDVLSKKNWKVNVYANVAYNKNKITKLYSDRDVYELVDYGLILRKGQPYGEFYMVKYAGVNPVNGDPLWYTADGEITNVYSDNDRVFMGKNMYAPWNGGFGTNISFKGITLSAHFNWVYGRHMMNNDRFFTESNGLYTGFNQSRKMFNRWQQPGDITDVPRYGATVVSDSRMLEDASYLRLKNLSLSYNLPREIVEKTKFFRSARVYAQAQNLLTFTKFSGLDPESTANIYRAAYPMSRQFTFGVELTF